MIQFFYKILSALKNFDFFLFFRLNLTILKKNYSKYPDYVQEFERTLANKFNFKYCLSFSSGTAAFYASILSLNLKRKSDNNKVLGEYFNYVKLHLSLTL